MKNIRVVIATFKNKISQEEIPFFRGSIIRLSDNASIIRKKDFIMPIHWYNING